jgi:tRNA(fMet)-specific endonuclease VapC
MPYLLDTNVVSDLVRNPRGRIAERLREVGEDDVFTSVIVVAELRDGAAKKGSPRLSAQLELVLGALKILPFEAPADRVYGEIRSDLERRGQMIGGNDLLIAAHAITAGATLVTDNEREFSRIRDLRSENWLERSPSA